MRPATRDRTARAVIDLQVLRKRIDRLDRHVVRVLSQRATLAVRTSDLKRRQGKPIFDRRREQRVLHQVLQANRGPLSRVALRAIYREILRTSRTLGISAKR